MQQGKLIAGDFSKPVTTSLIGERPLKARARRADGGYRVTGRKMFASMRNQRSVRRGDWKYLEVADREFLFDIAYDPRERGNLASKQPGMLAELRGQWEAWNREMLPVSEHLTPPMSNLSAMLW